MVRPASTRGEQAHHDKGASSPHSAPCSAPAQHPTQNSAPWAEFKILVGDTGGFLLATVPYFLASCRAWITFCTASFSMTSPCLRSPFARCSNTIACLSSSLFVLIASRYSLIKAISLLVTPLTSKSFSVIFFRSLTAPFSLASTASKMPRSDSLFW